VFATNEPMALTALLVTTLAKCRAPEDLAVIGCDRIPESACLTPPPTTIQQDPQELGRTALRQNVYMIQAGHEFGDGRGTVWIQPPLLVRASSVASQAGKEVTRPIQ